VSWLTAASWVLCQVTDWGIVFGVDTQHTALVRILAEMSSTGDMLLSREPFPMGMGEPRCTAVTGLQSSTRIKQGAGAGGVPEGV
jgi:hypothetical protein